MAESVRKTTVKGGVIARSAKTGRFVSVHTSSGKKRVATTVTESVVKGASKKRQSALKRLVNR